ncbi:MAG: hypothetical protein EOP45_22065, partial [Sphingobacteriaceae bacterium]
MRQSLQRQINVRQQHKPALHGHCTLLQSRYYLSYKVNETDLLVSKKLFLPAAIFTILFLFSSFHSSAQTSYQYPFQNPQLNAEKRIDNIISLLTLDEKIACLSTNPSVPRLGIKGTGQMEGLHGVALGGPGNWGRRKLVTTTTFPQSYGLAETWD